MHKSQSKRTNQRVIMRCTRALSQLQNQKSVCNACIFLWKKTSISGSGQANAGCHRNNSTVTVEVSSCCRHRKKKISRETASNYFFWHASKIWSVLHIPLYTLSHKQSHAVCPKHTRDQWIKASKTSHPQMNCTKEEWLHLHFKILAEHFFVLHLATTTKHAWETNFALLDIRRLIAADQKQ